MQPFVFLLFSSILCEWPGSLGLYDALRNSGVSTDITDSFRGYHHQIAQDKKESEIQGNTYEVPAEEIADDKVSEISKTQTRPDDFIDMTRRRDTKFFNWFKNSFNPKANGGKNETTQSPPVFDYLKENREQQTQITKALNNLQESFAKLNDYLEKVKKADTLILVKVPEVMYVNVTRKKRSVEENTTRSRVLGKKTVVTSVAVPVSVDPSKRVNPLNAEPDNVSKNYDSVNITKNLLSANLGENADLENVAKKDDPVNVSKTAPVEEKSAELCPFNNTRRAFSNIVAINDSLEVKKKLMAYIEEYFQDVQEQIGKLQEMKQVYSTDSNFRVGYIVANVDILQDNINKLRQETAANHRLWTERRLIEVFDKLKASHKVMIGLMQTVRNIYSGHKKGLKRTVPGKSIFANLVRKDSM